MAITVEELITIYRMNAASYKTGAKDVVNASKEAGEAIGHLAEGILALAGIGGMVELARKSLEVAGTFDVLERKHAGLTGSFERAKQIMSFGEEEAQRFGLFNPEALDTAAMKLEAFGLQAERYLPVVEKLGAVFGQGGEGLDTFAEAIGRIAEGNPGRAMMILARAGIGQKELEAHGVRFKGREVQSDAKTVINAIETVVTQKYGGVLKQMEDSPETQFAKLSIAWEVTMRKMGTGLQRVLLPVVDGLSKGLSNIAESGQMDRIVKGFSDLFHMDGSKGFESVITGIADTLEGMPAQIENMKNALVSAFDTIIPLLTVVASIWAGVMLAGPIVEFAGLVVAAWTAITGTIAAADAVAALFDALTGNLPAIVAGLAVAALTFAAITTAIQAAKDAVEGFGAGLPARGHGPKKPGFGDDWRKAVGGIEGAIQKDLYLQQIAEHTKRMADLQQRQLDIHRMLAGGGDILAHSLSNADLAGMASHGAHARVRQISAAIIDVVQAEVADALKRQGRLRTV